MDKGQILMDYRLAKNHKRQIPILADLNVCDTQTIVEILEEGGYKRMFNTNGVDISESLEERNAKVEKENDNLRKQIEQLESFNAELDATVKEQTEMLNGGKLYEDYQEVCIKNSKLNATVDVLVEKISMLKAVGCHG